MNIGKQSAIPFFFRRAVIKCTHRVNIVVVVICGLITGSTINSNSFLAWRVWSEFSIRRPRFIEFESFLVRKLMHQYFPSLLRASRCTLESKSSARRSVTFQWDNTKKARYLRYFQIFGICKCKRRMTPPRGSKPPWQITCSDESRLRKAAINITFVNVSALVEHHSSAPSSREADEKFRSTFWLWFKESGWIQSLCNNLWRLASSMDV